MLQLNVFTNRIAKAILLMAFVLAAILAVRFGYQLVNGVVLVTRIAFLAIFYFGQLMQAAVLVALLPTTLKQSHGFHGTSSKKQYLILTQEIII